MFLLDTTTVSELRRVRAGKSDAGVAGWAAGIHLSALFISVVTLLELEVGVLRAERIDPAQGSILRRWLDGSVMTAFEGRILPTDASIARRAASLHVPDPAPFADALIAATALVHGLTVVTRNARDFVRFGGLRVADPWTGRGA